MYTFAPMRAAVPRVAMPASRPQQRLVASLPSFMGMKASTALPIQLAGTFRPSLAQ